MLGRKFVSTWVIVLACLSLITACSNQTAVDYSTTKPVSDSYFIFDTIVSLRVYDERMTTDHFAQVRGLLEDIDQKMNRQLMDSEIDRVNQQAGLAAIKVSADTYHVIDAALAYSQSSDGKFDPTIGPLVDLWGIGSEDAAIPPESEITELLRLVNYKNVTLDPDALTVKLAVPGMTLDLGAIAKGYAADVIKTYLLDHQFKSAIIDLGGNIIAMGDKPGGKEWSIGIQDPAEHRGEHLGILKVRDQTIVTSGVYERFFKENDIVYHHILDTSTGYPVMGDLLSVSIITDTSMDADALSTTTFTLGLDNGMSLIESRDNTEAIFVTTDKRVYLTSGLQDKFELTNGGYQFAND
jgi:thiamine biosynthesis lipoprotein